MDKNNGEAKPAFCIKYFDSSEKEVGVEVPVDSVSMIEIRIRIEDLVANVDLGTAILRGFIDERKTEILNLIHLIRRKKAEQSKKILTPGLNKQGLHVLQ